MSRAADFHWNRTALRPWFRDVARITPSLLFPLAAVIYTLVAGPGASGPARIGQALGIAASLSSVVVVMHRINKKANVVVDAAIQAAFVLLLCVVVGVIGRAHYARDPVPYMHAFLLIAGLFALSVLVSALFAARFTVRENVLWSLPMSLRSTDLFPRESEPDISAASLVRAFFLTPFRSFFQLLVPVAVAVIFARADHVMITALIALAVTWVVLTFGNVDDGLDAMINVLRPLFLRGGAFFVTMLLIVLAGARIAGVSYVTTVLDSATAGTLLSGIFATYALCWWSDAWQGRLFTAEVLSLFGEVRDGCEVDYPINDDALATMVPSDGRTLLAHGASRFCAFRAPSFQTFDVASFTSALARRDDPAIADLRKAASFYFLLTNLVVVVGLVAAALLFKLGPQEPQLVARAATKPGVSLASLLKQKCEADETAIVIAASGGGTRAALHTASVLYALDELGYADDVILASGVSGGGASLAWFAGHRPSLFDPKTHDEAWDRYFDDMSYSYISDVLNGAYEMRILAGTRLGMLLKESFDHRWEGGRTQVSDVHELGLFFNTAIAGRFERPAGVDGSLSMAEARHRKMTTSTQAGGRLVFTNLALPAPFPTPALALDESIGLYTQVVRSDQTTLANAAALNANFPPVFSNAAVDLDDNVRFWVTDGGATDNRGMEMPLYALRDALDPSCLPKLRFVVADASAFSEGFSQDRGIGSIFAGGAMFASQLVVELNEDLKALYREHPERFSFHYIAMPSKLRAGALGTHWMLQPRVRVRNGGQSVIIDDAKQLVSLIRYMRRSDAPLLDPPAQTARAWCLDEASLNSEWKGLTQNLR